MKPEKRVTKAVEKVQDILAHYVEPGPRDCENTLNELMDVLDDERLIEAVHEIKDGRKNRGTRDRSKINMSEDFEVKYWTKALGVDREKLQRAVDRVGNSAAAVRKELGLLGARH